MTVTGISPPAASMVCRSGAMLKVHACAWLIVNACPAILSVPDLGAPGFGAALNDTLPLPLPLAPDVMVIQSASLRASHVQPPAVVTPTEPEPPAASTF